MSKFKVGDTVRRISKYSHGVVVFGGVYTVSGVRTHDGALTLEEDTRHGWIYDDTKFELVQDTPEQPVLTPQEVFTAILEGTPLEYRVTVRGVACRWYTLTNPERINLADVKYSEFRKQIQTVTLSGTVPKPLDNRNVEDTDVVYTVHLSTMQTVQTRGRYIMDTGMYWSTYNDAEKFLVTLKQCFSTVPVLD